MKHEMMRKHKEAQETMKEESRRNDGKSKQKRNFEEDMKAEKVSSGSDFNQRSDLARKSSDSGGGGSDQHKLQAPMECDIPRTPTPDYADLNARFIKRLYFHVILGAQIVGLKISWV